MTQNDVNRAVARATGETVERIKKLGFNMVIVPRFLPKPRRHGAYARQPKIANVNIHQPKAA